ncbi:MAG: DUF2339 domain-containing protein [Gammaproteobacteria bacterium]|nr:DUF2339 domain-containing protein [Gammaproteobacteria bacterium]
MQFLPIIVAAFFGVILAQSGQALLGLATGAAVGFLLTRIRALETRIDELRSTHAASRLSSSAATAPASAQREKTEAPDEWAAKALQSSPVEDVKPPDAGLFAPQDEQEQQAAAPQARRPSPLDKLLAAAKHWLTSGNVPVKVGIIILFFGVAFLFKYAVEHRVLVLPIELRLLAVVVLAGAIFIFGWRLRAKSRVYALNLQGAGIGVLYLTIYAAFRLYSVLPATFAFALLVLLTFASGALAVKQNSRGLAAFASIGGFLAPLLASTGQGSHVALFSYYLLINTAILGISWFRAWRSLNLIGFVFTFVVGTYWGFQYYTPELYASVQPFLILNFLFYQAIAILYSFRQPPKLRGLVDGSLIFGTPAIVFALQTQLVADTQWGLAISAGVIALYYVSVAAWLRHRHQQLMQLLTQSMLVLAVGFATIAVPLALDDRWSAIAWALEGAGVVWLGVRQTSSLSRLTGAVLIFGSGYFYAEHGWRYDEGLAVFNGNVLGGLIIACAAIFAARLLATDVRKMPQQSLISAALLLWGASWWLGTGAMEIGDRAHGDLLLNSFIVFVAASFSLLGLLSHYRNWLAARRLTFLYSPLLLPLALGFLLENDHIFDGWGPLIWLLALAAHFLLLRLAENANQRTLFIWHVGGALLIVALFSHEAFWQVRAMVRGEVWRDSAALLVPLLGSLGLLAARKRTFWPLRPHGPAYFTAAAIMTGGQLLLLLGNVITNPGDPAPMTYIPILNPFDLLTLIGLASGYWIYRLWPSEDSHVPVRQQQVAMVALAGMAFCLTTLMVVRGVHQFGNVIWDEFALRRSVSVQSALSIYWAALGFGSMIVGTRQARYWIWMTGVGLMVVVVLKLFFVDLGNTGTIARIISFLGVGGLLMVVGYFAPRPPKPVTPHPDQ